MTDPIAFSHNQGLDCQPSHTHTPSLRVGGAGAAVMRDVQVRRLTPVECERLMGWPDDHTRWRADGTEVPDSTRYRMCGNGVASPVAEWLAAQLNRTLETK